MLKIHIQKFPKKAKTHDNQKVIKGFGLSICAPGRSN